MAGWRAALVVLAALALASPLIRAWSQRAEEQAEAVAPAGGEIADLRAQLTRERERSRQLALEVAALKQRVDALAGAAAGPAEAGAAGTAQAPPAADAGAEDAPAKWFDADALMRAGMQPYELDRLREVFDSSEMALIELRDRAMREGWYGTPRYMVALRDLRQGLRTEIGDDSYDELLYATGRKNRVVVREVLRGSPGESAGFSAGDVLLSYNGRRIFKPAELVQATTQTSPGDSVPVDVLHNGSPQRYWVPGGPIGMQVDGINQPPDTGH